MPLECQYGKQFFLRLTSAAGRRANLVALAGVLVAGVVRPGDCETMDLNSRLRARFVRGVGDQHRKPARPPSATLGNDDPAVGYSVSYPFGVAGPILILYFAIRDPQGRRSTRTAASGLEMLEIALHNQEHFGKTLARS